MKTRILNTKELFRVIYDDGDFEAFIKQTYTDGTPPFYTLEKGVSKLTPVETSSENLKEIARHLERSIRIDMGALRQEYNRCNPKVIATHEYCLSKKREFLKKLKALPEYKSL